MDWSHSLRLIAPEETLSIAGLILLLIAAWGGDKASRLISILAVAALVGASFLVAPALCQGAMGPDYAAFFGQVHADAFSSFAKILIYLSAASALVVAPAFLNRLGAMRPEFPVLIVFAALGSGMMVSAGDLLALYIGLEMNSLAAYVLASFARTDDRSAEAGLKYFVLGALASGILLFGMSLTYGFTGTTAFSGIDASLAGGLSTGALFGIVFILAGLAFKISAVPFHMWTPDVYEGAPTPVTKFFATSGKVAAIGLTMRVMLGAFGDQVDAWRQIIVFVALASIVVGALGAIGQKNIKRLMAYSSINNVGFILIGLAAANVQGASAMLFYLVLYIAMTVAGFAAMLMLKDENGNQVEEIAKFSGLSRTRPGLALALAIVMFSLAGIPPLFGFWGKFLVFKAAVDADMMALAFLGFAASVIGAFYYLKIVKVIYFDEPADAVKGENDIWHKAILVVTCVFISPLGYLASGWLQGLTDTAATALFQAL
ncbi:MULTISPECIES: NADH-quinone oxidoreductase subunit NuoN [Novosphingobium]|jgi:NADH-quinone oxidoreductase subunit N|uniref:NADH-quinone oxidoreductase subunit N n=1 Tax=Novosphingobium panipatense TaxID=428991 RepID=A0ABY1QN60_9SPHN|nr:MULTISPECIES: NADH-quinone oxidoreductase subunit NuoN [Novosphingobium]SMP74342.1 NADH dehydrogenase subunit N [Novosphingobium panipatense]